MNCPRCHTQNRPNARFCSGCGQALPAGPAPLPYSPPPPPVAPGGYGPPPAYAPPPAARPAPSDKMWVVAGVGILLLLLLCGGVGLLWYSLSSDGATVVDDTTTATTAAATGDTTPTDSPEAAPADIAVTEPAVTRAPAAEPAEAVTPVPEPSTADEPTPEPTVTPPAGPTPTLTPITIPGTDIEIPRISDEEERDIGRKVARQVEEEEYRLYNNSEQRQRIEKLGLQIVPHCDRPQLAYEFKLLDTDEINAFAVPGGFIYVTRGMLEFAESDAELVSVLAHEIAHVAQRHGAETLEAFAAAEAAGALLLESQPDLADIYDTEGGQLATQFTTFLVYNGWSQQNEYEADEYGAIYMARAGYDPEIMIEMMRRMQAKFQPEDPGAAEQWFSTHPPFDDRIQWIEEVIEREGI